MLLPTKNQIQNKFNSEETLRILRIKELREAEEKLRLSVTRTELDFQKMLASNQKEWEKEFEEHQTEVKKMKAEIDKLTAERMAVAIPYDILKESAENRIKDAKLILEKVNQKELYNEDLKIRLEKKLSEVEDREDIIKQTEQKLLLQKEINKKETQVLNDTRAKLAISINKFTEDSNQKRTELLNKETQLTLKENSLKSQEEGLRGKEQDIINRERILRDQQEVLARAWKELKNKTTVPL